MGEVEDQIRALDEAIATHPPAPADFVAWRIADSPLLYAHAPRLIGCEIADLGFFDVTLDQAVAERHMPASHPVLVRILMPAGTRAVLADENEAALLLGRGSRFRVVAVDRPEEGDPMVLHLEVVA